MRGNRNVDQAKLDRQHSAAFSKGGRTKMFDEQAAAPARAGRGGKPDDPGPGARSARGGPVVRGGGGGRAMPAQGGRTGPR